MKFSLPFPPSSNVYWRRARNRIIVSAQAKAYKQEVGLMLNLLNFTPFKGPVVVEMFVYMPYPRKGDLSNYEKVLLDCLQGHAYTNDNLVHELHMYRRYDKQAPRVDLMIAPVPSVDGRVQQIKIAEKPKRTRKKAA